MRLYGLNWKEDADLAQVEMKMIQRGGHEGNLAQHYLTLRKLIWPDRLTCSWTPLIYREILQNQMTILMGCASSWKTSTASEFVLLDYWCFPQITAVLVSTTTREKAEDAVWAEIKMLFQKGKKARPWLAGNILDYRQAILTEDLEKDGIRDLRKGLKVKACYVGQSYVGLGVFAGIKQQRVRFLADELQYMPATFLDCLPNMFSNPDVKVIGSGNPNHDPDTQLAISAEPKDGWAVVEHIEETTVWDTAFHQSRCVNLIGTDSDNFKSDPTKPEPFPRLIGPRYAKKIAHDYGENSPEMETQVRGRMKLSLASARVITRLICKEHHAHDKAVWSGKPLMKIHACDPAFGGGDRCVSGHIEIGEDVQGKTVVRVPMPHTIKIDLRLPKSAEIQIVEAVKRELDAEGIPAKNSFYDSFGKGTIGFSYSTIFGSECPVPVDSGGKCTKRPVRQDFFVDEQDNRGRVTRRLKRCDEHYSKFVTEMWFTVRYVIEAEQMRELPMAIVEEGCQREYGDVEGGKIEVEPKDQMRLRKNKSPDLFDWLAIAIEGARRLGFVVDRLGNEEDDGDPKWLEDLRERQKTLRKDYNLQTSF